MPPLRYKLLLALEMNAGRSLHKKLSHDCFPCIHRDRSGNSVLASPLVARKRRVGRCSNYVFSWQSREEPILKPLKKS
jgi:hypothetical protein